MKRRKASLVAQAGLEPATFGLRTRNCLDFTPILAKSFFLPRCKGLMSYWPRAGKRGIL